MYSLLNLYLPSSDSIFGISGFFFHPTTQVRQPILTGSDLSSLAGSGESQLLQLVSSGDDQAVTSLVTSLASVLNVENVTDEGDTQSRKEVSCDLI